jgi:hypothetical protein
MKHHAIWRFGMSKALRNSLIVLVVIIGAAALVLVGMYFGRAWYGPMGFPGDMMGISAFDDNTQLPYGMGQGMMGQGMIGSYGFNSAIAADPLSLTEAEDALEAYLEGLGVDDLALGEIMIFENHAYAQIIEAGTGIGAIEVLVDPVTGAVSPEHGPNMMWNIKYSPMAGSGMMGMMGMMGGFGAAGQQGMMGGQFNTEDLSAEMPISAEKAIQSAQAYLDAYLPGAEADEEADPFYGYYTIHINNEGDTVGMLSVNGYTGEVFVHNWHGDLIEMSEAH